MPDAAILQQQTAGKTLAVKWVENVEDYRDFFGISQGKKATLPSSNAN